MRSRNTCQLGQELSNSDMLSVIMLCNVCSVLLHTALPLFERNSGKGYLKSGLVTGLFN